LVGKHLMRCFMKGQVLHFNVECTLKAIDKVI
jgi:hypothetical protein